MQKNQLSVSLEDIVAQLPGHVYWLDRNNIFLGSNDVQAIAAGFKNRYEIVGKSNYEMPWRDHADTFNMTNNKVMSTGQAQVLEEVGKYKDGIEYTVLSHKIPLRNREGNVTGMLGISFDITQHKSQEKNLKDEIEKTALALNNIIDHLPGNVYWLDKNNVYLGCNKVQAISAGLEDRYEIIGKTNFDMPWHAQADAYNIVNNTVMMTGQECSVEEIARHIDGKERIFLSKKVPLRDAKDNIIGVLGISFDITEQKEAERKLVIAKQQAEAANQAKSAFLQNIRHDLRTPISGIISVAELLKHEDDKQKIIQHANSILASSQELLQFLNEVLDSVNLATSNFPLVKKKFGFKSILQQAVNLCQATATGKQLTLNFLFEENVPEYLIGDPMRIYRIVVELLNNALKFTHQGTVNLVVKLHAKHGRSLTVIILIEDTGIGIPLDQQQEIFTSFKRLSPSYLGLYKGAGLGLSIVKQFIEELDGEIHVESQGDNTGTKFFCFIPFRESLATGLFEDESETYALETQTNKFFAIEKPAPKPVQIIDINKNSKVTSTNIKAENNSLVLLVEDHPVIAFAEKAMLAKLSCQVDHAADGNSAIELAKKTNYDFIFMDIGLPDIDGYEVTKKIRLQEIAQGEGRQVPIVALTAHVGSDNHQSCINAGMNAVLNKPLTMDMATETLATFIPHWKKL